jgi:hypothetical protein
MFHQFGSTLGTIGTLCQQPFPVDHCEKICSRKCAPDQVKKGISCIASQEDEEGRGFSVSFLVYHSLPMVPLRVFLTHFQRASDV